MGAKQSKRSVDISGKDAEGAGEVAAAGAGGEGRLESIADADNLKPQINGDTPHIQAPEELTEKEKQLDSGTPENEKDATTEKEKNQENDKEVIPVTNGDSEPKVETEKENGEATPEQEGKKPKKEKVKKKWSLRSISFSRKDKPKQEKKQKDDDSKINGEPEKVPEEAAEATVEAVESTAAEIEKKDDKTPETPVTEPITNGSSTPESPKVESPATEASAADASLPVDRTEATPIITEPEQLPVNGLSIDEPKKEIPEVAEAVESKTKEIVAEPEPVPVPEIPVKTEVCVEQVPLVESSPPPLPANPPPSSVASFAATTMAPELTDALAITAGTDIPAPSEIPITESIQVVAPESVTSAPNIETDESKSILTPLSDTNINDKPSEVVQHDLINETKEIIETPSLVSNIDNPAKVSEPEITSNVESVPQVVDKAESEQQVEVFPVVEAESESAENIEIASPVPNEAPSVQQVVIPPPVSENIITEEISPPATESVQQSVSVEIIPSLIETENLPKTEIVSTVNESESAADVLLTVNETDSIPEVDIAPPQDNISLPIQKVENDIVSTKSEILEPIVSEEIVNKDEPVTETNSEVIASGDPSLEKLEENTDNNSLVASEKTVISNHIENEVNELNGKDTIKLNGNDEETEEENLKNKTKDVQEPECNGNINEADKPIAKKISTEITLPVPETIEDKTMSEEKIVTPDESSPTSLSEATDSLPPPAAEAEVMSHSPSEELSASLPPPPTDLCSLASDPQDPLPVHDKIADLIPEVPDLPTETLQETASDVAVSN